MINPILHFSLEHLSSRVIGSCFLLKHLLNVSTDMLNMKMCFTWGTYYPVIYRGQIQIKVLRVFLLAIHSHLYIFALRFIFLRTHATSYVFSSNLHNLYFYSKVTVHCKGARKKTCQKTIPSFLYFQKSIQKHQV